MALSAVLLPAPLGPIRPRMRPSSTFRSTPSSATVVPKVLRRPRASMLAMAQPSFARRCRRAQQLLGVEAQPLDGGVDRRPLLGQEPLALRLEQQLARAGVDEHAQAPPLLHQLLVGQLLIGLQHRQRIDPVVGRDVAHRRQRIALVQHAVEDHGDDPVAQLAIDRLAVIPLMIHRDRVRANAVLSGRTGAPKRRQIGEEKRP